MGVTPEDLEAVKSFDDIAALFGRSDKLDWPVSEWATFSQVLGDYGIDEKDIPGVRSLQAVQKIDDLDWGIFLVDFGGNDLKRKDLRRILDKVAEKARQTHDNRVWPHENILFIIRHNTSAFSFGHFTGEKLAQAKLRTFGWSDPLEARTAVDNLNKLTWAADWREAWNVEKLTKDFFTKLSDLFYDTLDAVAKQIPEEPEPRLFVQTLFNRLLFLRFVEKKNWLSLAKRKDYLRALWETSKSSETPLWPTRLNALFGALNHPKSDQIHRISRPLIGDVEYLNGGLFDDDPRFADPRVSVPTSLFDALIGQEGLFYVYNFTVEESSPLDVQVAVDPEILGKIFEQLTLSQKRHDTGSYYTPREVVQFMCREALSGYLTEKGLEETKARALVYDHDDHALSNPEGKLAFEALKVAKIVDPACGSGAYLLGMLHELYGLFALLRRVDRQFSDDPAREEHDRKLHIIENNIYGVDLQAFATNTAMLRLWLTLLVEDTGEIPQPLPNLEYKIEVGDALLGPDPSQAIDWQKSQRGFDFESVHETVDDLRNLRAKYQGSHGQEKRDFKGAFEGKLAELRRKVTGSAAKDPTQFDWRVEFFDVFLDEPTKRSPGFDIVVANPPYVRPHNLAEATKHALWRAYSTFEKKADLYVCFVERGLSLASAGGAIVYIVSNGWLRLDSFEKLRVLLLRNTTLNAILDFEGDIFASATVKTCVFHVTKKPAFENMLKVAAAREAKEIPTLAFRRIPQAVFEATYKHVFDLSSDVEADTVKERMRAGSEPLGNIVEISFGLKTGDDATFITRSQKTNSHMPLLRGADVGRYEARFKGEYVWYVPEKMRARRKTARPGTSSRFEQPKVLVRDTGNGLIATFDPDNFYVKDLLVLTEPTGNTNFLLALTGVLNSKLMRFYYETTFPTLHVQRDELASLPIKTGPLRAASADLAQLVTSVLAKKALNEETAILENEIDRRIEFLYFHQGEAPTYDEWVAKRKAEEGTKIEHLRRLIAGGETGKVEFKQSLEYVDPNDPEILKAPEGQPRQNKLNTTRAAVVHSALKTICAYINSSGGTLLIGVHDKKDIIGVEPDYTLLGKEKDQDGDGFERKLRSLADTRFNVRPIQLFDAPVINIDGKDVCWVSVRPSCEPFYLDGEFFIRDGNRTIALIDHERDNYIANRRKNCDDILKLGPDK